MNEKSDNIIDSFIIIIYTFFSHFHAAVFLSHEEYFHRNCSIQHWATESAGFFHRLTAEYIFFKFDLWAEMADITKKINYQ